MKQRRTRIVVDGHFQYRFVLVGILIAFILINTTLITGFFVSDLMIFDASPEVIYAITVGITEIVCLIIFFFSSLKSSHRIAGPLYQIEQNLKKIAKGDLTTKTHFRKNDHFHDLGAQLTQTTQQYCQCFKELKQTTETLVSQLDNDSMALETVQRLRTQLAEFNTGPNEKDDAAGTFALSSREMDQ